MKKYILILSCLCLYIQNANAFLNIGGNYSKNYYSIQNNFVTSYVGMEKLADAVDHLAVEVNELSKGVKENKWNNEERQRLQSYYQLDRIGKNIGIDLNSAFAGEVVQKAGVAGLQRLIEDRIFYLETDLKLTKAVEFSFLNSSNENSDMTSKDLDLGSPTQKLNPLYLTQMIDFIRRNPQYRSQSPVMAEDFLKLTKNLNPNDKQILIGQPLSEAENSKIVKYLFRVIQDGLEKSGSPIDFTGIDFSNLGESAEAIDVLANSFNRNVKIADQKLSQDLKACDGLSKRVEKSKNDVKSMDQAICQKYYKSEKGKLSKRDQIYKQLAQLEARIYELETKRGSTWYRIRDEIGKPSAEMKALDVQITNARNEYDAVYSTMAPIFDIFEKYNLQVYDYFSCLKGINEISQSSNDIEFTYSGQMRCERLKDVQSGRDLLTAKLSKGTPKAQLQGSTK